MGAAGPVEMAVQVAADGAAADEIDLLARGLLVELRELPVKVRMAPGGPPVRGAKSDTLLTVGELALTALPGALAAVVAVLRSWLKRGDGRSVKIKWADGKRSFAVDIPAGTLSHQQLKELLATLGATGPATRTPTPAS
jgi:hypothetical protein